MAVILDPPFSALASLRSGSFRKVWMAMEATPSAVTDSATINARAESNSTKLLETGRFASP